MIRPCHTADDRALSLAVVSDFPFAPAGVAALLKPYDQRVRVEQLIGVLPPRGAFDVVLLDVIGCTAHLLKRAINETGAAVLLFSDADGREQIDKAVRVGAAGFVTTTAGGSEILAAVETAAGVLHRSAPSSETDSKETWPGQHLGLTSRESEVVSLIVCGMSNKDIASEMYLSINSIKSYIRTGYRKMGVTSRSQAVLWGLEHGLRVEQLPSPIRLSPVLQRGTPTGTRHRT